MADNSYRTGMADRIRAAVKKLDSMDGFSRGELFDHVEKDKPLSLQEERSFKNTFKDLFKRGEIRRISVGRFRYADEFIPRANVCQRIYRAMHVKGAFCTKDIQILTDADRSYINVIIRKLAKGGHLELTGKTPRGSIFRVKHPNQFYLEFVHDGQTAAGERNKVKGKREILR